VSLETNITKFVCPQCGCRSLVRVIVGATVLADVASVGLGPDGPRATVYGTTVEGGRFAGFACASCRRPVAADADGLLAFAGEWQDVENVEGRGGSRTPQTLSTAVS
jgi:hypothetical protein